jgi:hypothetical protein
MHIFQNGVSTFNVVDMNNMLKTITKETTTHYEGLVEKQLNRQVTQIVDIICKANELPQDDIDEINDNRGPRLATSIKFSAKLNHLQEVMNELQTVLNVQVKDMASELNQQVSQLEQKMEVSEQKNMDRLQQLAQKMEVSEQKNMDRLQQLEEMNMDRLQQLEQKIDALMNFLKNK